MSRHIGLAGRLTRRYSQPRAFDEQLLIELGDGIAFAVRTTLAAVSPNIATRVLVDEAAYVISMRTAPLKELSRDDDGRRQRRMALATELAIACQVDLIRGGFFAKSTGAFDDPVGHLDVVGKWSDLRVAEVHLARRGLIEQTPHQA